MWTHYVHMKTVTVRELRNNFPKLETWLREGEQIRIEKRGQPIAVLTAIPARRGKAARKPDFAARLEALWGERVFSQAEVATMRAAELEGEQG
jgi:antitoxin (DNA-binding transcriptional repressor) of toxin-antitoxin stability system